MSCIFVTNMIILVILAGGAVFDLRDHRIPNWWVFGASAIGLLLQVLFRLGETEAVWKLPLWFFLRCLAVVVVFSPLFRCRMMGAGDIKLMSSICGFMGFLDGGFSILIGLVIGAVMALVKLLFQRSLINRLGYLYAYIRRLILTKELTAYHNSARDGYEHTIPFGLCLFLGALLYITAVKFGR